MKGTPKFEQNLIKYFEIECGSLFGKTGAFERGYSFDALVVCGVQDDFMRLKPSHVVERFCYGGETKNIKARFLRGKSI